MPSLHRIELFGGLRVRTGHEVVTRFPSQKAGLLLAFLAIKASKPQPREHIIDLLWPELELDAGRNNLSTLLSFLRRVLEPGATPKGTVLLADRATIGLNRDNLETDLAEFEGLRDRAARVSDFDTRLTLLRNAADLACEELLPGIYEEWALETRNHYAEQYRLVVRQQALLLLGERHFEAAQAPASQWFERDRTDIEAYQTLLKAYAGTGQLERAFGAFARYEAALEENFGISSDPATLALVQQLRENPAAFAVALPPLEIKTVTFAVVNPPDRAVAVIAVPANPTQVEEKTFASRLPKPLTRFFGRDREQETLLEWLRDPEERLVTMLGSGGAGKTRLAIQIAHRLSADFEGNVLFVPLADIASPVLMPLLLQNALELPMSPGDPLGCVIAALADKPTLLILDNMEHLLGEEETKSENPLGNSGRVFVKKLLDSLPFLRCLVTSRQALHLEGEQEFYLPPLEFPDENTDLCSGEFASVALYVDRAQKAKADFALTAHNAPAIAALCRKLEGMPLALEMAAAWVKTLPPAKVLERLEHQLEVLVSRRRDLPARQQSLRATCEWSYGQLTPELQRAFAYLSLFHGGWTLEAAEALLGAEALEILAELQERSLVLIVKSLSENETDSVRYRMLEPLREFGREKLSVSGEEEEAQKSHALCFLDFAERAREKLRSSEEKCWLSRLRNELENLRDAIHWTERNQPQIALRFVAALTRYWELAGAFVEGCRCGTRILALPGNDAPTENRAHALQGLGTLLMLQTDYELAFAYHQEACDLFATLGHRAGQASALHGLGNITFYQQDYPVARAYYEQSLEIRVGLGDARALGSCYHSLGNLEMREDNFDVAREHFERALKLRRQCGDELGIAYTLGALGQLASQREDDELALGYFREVAQLLFAADIPWTLALSLQNIAQVIQGRNQLWDAVCLFGTVQKLRESTNYQVPHAEREARREQIEAFQRELGDRAFSEAWQEGYAMKTAQAVAYALRVSEGPVAMPAAP